MIAAKLIYNPYLRETKITFNGAEPHINSLVEKYQGEALQNWINQVPSIFRDEMNGYDFTLEFEGTKTDYEELRKAFDRADVTQKMVNVVLLKDLADRNEKIKLIDDLLEWLNENRNHNFDLEKFRTDNNELFEGSYPFITINGRGLDTSMYENTDISVENVDVMAELDNTDLTHTPVLFCLDKEYLPNLRGNLLYMRNRKDVRNEQLFFYISPQLNRKKADRLISDYGIMDPQLVTGADDQKITRYMELFPFTDYIADSINVIRKSVEGISLKLEKANLEGAKTNSVVHEQLKDMDSSISEIKTTIDIFEQKDNFQIPDEWKTELDYLIERIYSWNKKKVKITNAEDAAVEAVRFNKELQTYYREFCSTLLKGTSRASTDLQNLMRSWYSLAEIGDDFQLKTDKLVVQGSTKIDEITADLLKLKEEKVVEAKDDIMGLLFGQYSEKKYVKEVNYYYQKWREYAAELAREAAEKLMNNLCRTVSDYYETTARTYLEKLEYELKVAIAKRNEISSQLSDDEKNLQADNNWLGEFKDQLKEIERG